MRVLTIGSAMQDMFVLHSTPESIQLETPEGKKCFLLLQEGVKIEVPDLPKYIGGGATNSAVSFGRLGQQTGSFFKIGNDDAGKYIMHTLKKEGIDLSLVCKTEKKETGTSIILPCASGERTTFVYRGANLTLEKNELPSNAIAKTDLLYLTSLSGPLAPLLSPIVQHTKKETLVACNPGTSQLKGGAHHLRDALPEIDIFILNGYEAQLLFTELLSHKPSLAQKVTEKANRSDGKELPRLLNPQPMENGKNFDLQVYFQAICNYGPQIAVVTDGADGVYVAHKDTILYYPSLQIKVESTLGAGDAFGSTFTAYIAQGSSIEEALFAGISNAASVIEHLDTQTGLLKKDTLEESVKQIDTKKLQTFSLQ